MGRNVPLRRSLLIRLLSVSVLIALCSIAATAWLAVQSTTRAIQQAQGQALSSDVRIYDTLLGYAATHPTWDGVGPTVQKLAASTGRQITLTLPDRLPIAGSTAPGATIGPLPQEESAVIDPLRTDAALQPDADGRIDPRVVGPYRLSQAERQEQEAIAVKTLDCLTKGQSLPIESRPLAIQDLAGYISTSIPNDPELIARYAEICGIPRLAVAGPAETKALTALTRSVDRCLKSRRHDVVKLTVVIDAQSRPTQRRNLDRTTQDCLDSSRRKQFRSYVAPAALLFVRSPGGVSQPSFDLSGANVTRIVGVAALVLLITVAVTVLVGARLVRPLRALTAAAQDPTGHHARVPVTGRDEIGVLAMALNSLSERRERAEEQRTAMVSDVAHELRTPLTNIRSWLEAVQDGLATVASDPALTAALLREALQLQAIIDDLQDLAAADAAGLRLSPEPVPVAEMLTQVITAHGVSAEAAGVQLTADADDQLEVSADPVRLRQALGNLVSNAIRYTPQGGSVSLVARRDGEEAVISVVDDGTGIAPADLPYVFDRFWRPDRSRSRETGGSGLGLAIVRQIAEAHAGSVTATSVDGRGSRFDLRLPLRASENLSRRTP
jgi:two-component system sensor histidine kinase BaeS